MAEYLYTFSVQTNLFSRIIGGLVKLVDLLKRGGGDYRGDTVAGL